MTPLVGLFVILKLFLKLNKIGAKELVIGQKLKYLSQTRPHDKFLFFVQVV
jgi:hypothetical protein